MSDQTEMIVSNKWKMEVTEVYNVQMGWMHATYLFIRS